MPVGVDFFFFGTTGDLHSYLPLGNNHYIHKHTTYEVAAQRSKNKTSVYIQPPVWKNAVNFFEVLDHPQYLG